MATHFFSKNPSIVNWYNSYLSIPFSEKFYDFLDNRMVSLVKKGIGLSPSPQFTVASISTQDGIEMYEPAEISRLRFFIGIASVARHPITFCWKSKSEKIVSIDETDFNEENLECWLEGLTPEKYYEDLALYTNKKAPFKISKLPFELEIRDYAYSMHVYINLNSVERVDEINLDLDRIIQMHNNNTDARDRGLAKGAPLQELHNWKITIEADDRIMIYLDAASPEILKTLVKGLIKYDEVTKVEMDLTN